MSLTVIAQELFKGAGTVRNGGNLGAFNSATGTFTCYPGGPRAASDTTANSLGWSGDPSAFVGSGGSVHNTEGVFTSSVPTSGGVCGFFYVDALQNTGGSTNEAQIVGAFFQSGGNNAAYATVGNNGHFFTYLLGGPLTDSGASVPIRQWFEFRQLWQNNGGNNYTAQFQFRLAQSSTWTVLASGSATSNGVPYYVFIGENLNYNSDPYWRGRVGACTMFSIGSISTDGATLLPSLVDPPLHPAITHYVDPANYTGVASDSNDGVTPTTPLKTLSQIETMTSAPDYGFFAPATAWQQASGGVPNGTALDITQHVAVLDGNQKLAGGLLYEYLHGTAALAGDTLVINYAGGAEIPFGLTSALFLETSGLTCVSSGGTANPAILSLFKTIPSSEWSLVAGKTYTYQATDSVADSVLLQNRIAMNHPTGANYAAVASYLELTPGSFWTDGTTMYVHPFGSSNPGTDGNRYERTTVWVGSIVQSGVCVAAPNMLIKGITVMGTTLTDPSAGGNVAGYALSVNDVSNSFVVFDSCKSDYGTNHDFAQVASTTGFNNCRFALVNCVAQRGGPYATGSAYWAYVDYTPPGAGTGNETVYYNCNTGAGAMQVIGSAMPSNNGYAWGTHGNAGGWQNIFIIGCDFSKSNGISAQSGAPMTCADSKFMGSVGGSSTALFQRCWIYDEAIAPGCTLNNCLLTFNNTTAISSSGATTVLNRCTLDATQSTAAAVFTSAGSNSFTMNQCAVLGSAMFLENIQSTDAVALSHNEIQGTSSATILNSASLGNLTLAAAQSHGLDVGSAMNNAPAVDAITYQRTSQSVVVHPVGSTTDMTGVDFAIRRTAGAAEYIPSTGVGAIPSRDGQLHRARQ
jgi:hypothetical protein